MIRESHASYRKTTTVDGNEVRLHDDVLERIGRKHGELRGFEPLILETVNDPDLILEGHGRELLAMKHYATTPIGAKHMVVVYREDKQLIITAFLTSDPSKLLRKRQQVWQRRNK